MRTIDADKAKEIMSRLIPEPELCRADDAFDEWTDGLATGIRRCMIVLDMCSTIKQLDRGRADG